MRDPRCLSALMEMFSSGVIASEFSKHFKQPVVSDDFEEPDEPLFEKVLQKIFGRFTST